MISSTARDLPEHRKEVMDACLRQGMFPVMMEHLPASDDEAISASLKMVDEADIYVGIFAHRYGYVPKGRAISVTEMEYNRAVERKIPRLIFVMDKDHSLKIEDVEMGEGATKLESFKKRLLTDNIVNFFKSPADLRAHVINSLSKYHEADITQFHYVSDIPQPPEAYIAHPYTLLQTHRLIGRQDELNSLTDWVSVGATHASPLQDVHIMNIVAIGGMGKSALTWKWFNDIASQEMKPLAGRMWWSFYESDASFENFVIRALAYVTKQSREDVQKISPPEREAQLLAALDREPFLIVLDGLERILLAYARMDAARLGDDDIDQRTANYVAKAYGLPESAADPSLHSGLVGQHLLRKTADPRAGSFLRKLANVRATRILVSTRLYPADLQTAIGEPLRGCFAIFLRGLNDDDALDLWRTFKVNGRRDGLLPLFNRFDNHPQLLQLLAARVANYRPAPRNFDRWSQDHPDFDPFRIPIVNVKSHVLEFAMHGLEDQERRVLETFAGFRLPVTYDILISLLVGKERLPTGNNKLFADETELDVALTQLEDRGLLAWDRQTNRYDIHPIIRGVVWGTMDNRARHNTAKDLGITFFFLRFNEPNATKEITDLTASIELMNSLIHLELYDDAWEIYRDSLQAILLGQGAVRENYELINAFFTRGWDELPQLKKSTDQAGALLALARTLRIKGEIESATKLLCRHIDICRVENDSLSTFIGSLLLSNFLLMSGKIAEANVIVNKMTFSSTNNSFWDRIGRALGKLASGQLLLVRGSIDDALKDLSESAQLLEFSDLRSHERSYLIALTKTDSRIWTQLEDIAMIGRLAKILKNMCRSLINENLEPNSEDEDIRSVDIPLEDYTDFMLLDRPHKKARSFIREISDTSPTLIAKDSKVAGKEMMLSQQLQRVTNPKYNVILLLLSVWLQGEEALDRNNLVEADENFHAALAKAREKNIVDVEIQALVSMADLLHQKGNLKAARELLDDVWEYAERGPYPLFHADAFNVLAQIERDAGNNAAAVEAATKAYRLAWCDGEPYSYHWGLVAARKHLKDLGAPEPQMPPFDASRYEPMPEVEINPRDEFYVEVDDETKDEG
jgi:tetratricopeptide (TPR) repeat protein